MIALMMAGAILVPFAVLFGTLMLIHRMEDGRWGRARLRFDACPPPRPVSYGNGISRSALARVTAEPTGPWPGVAPPRQPWPVREPSVDSPTVTAAIRRARHQA